MITCVSRAQFHNDLIQNISGTHRCISDRSIKNVERRIQSQPMNLLNISCIC